MPQNLSQTKAEVEPAPVTIEKEEKNVVEYLEPTKNARAEKVRNADLYEALQDTKINPRSKESLQLYFAIFVGFCCACANGYDGTLLTGILSMKHFQNTFHSGLDGPKVSLIASLYGVAGMALTPINPVICDRFGRKLGMVIGSVTIIVGMIVAVTAKSIAQLAVGRFILGGGVSLLTMGAPMLVMELSPPQWRGRATGLYNCGWFGGTIPAAAVTFGTNSLDSNLSWQIPIILQAVGCCIVLCSVWFIPESPRYHMMQGRFEEARQFLIKYHGNGDPSSKLVALEYAEFMDTITQDGIDKRWWDYRPIFGSHSGRWRMAQVMMMNIFGQYSGNGLAYFNTVIYGHLGITSVPLQLAYNLLYSVVAGIGAFAGASLTDRMPRRKILVIGTLVCSGWLWINAGLQLHLTKLPPDSPAAHSTAQGALAAYLLFNVCFMFSYTPLQAVTTVENLDTNIRAKGLAAGGFLSGCMGFINQFAGPIALQNIGYNYVFVFAGWDIIEAIMWYFFCVETQGRTLEELEWVYAQPNPVKASKQYDEILVREDGAVLRMDA